ncbi:uridine kinase [bacterium]|nr:MAG: uridine kinase [bacterium]
MLKLNPVGTRFVAIGGGTGSGKSTLAEAISDRLGAPIIRIDDYYRDQEHLPVPVRRAVNYDAPESVEHALLIAHLDRLASGRAIEKPIYDFTRDTRSPLTERVEAAPVVLIEGIFALCWAEVAARCATRIFVEAPAEVRFRRRLRRDVEVRGRDEHEVTTRFWRHVAPMHDRWVAPSRVLATRIVDGEQPIDRLLTLALAEMKTPSTVAAPMLPRLSSVLFA